MTTEEFIAKANEIHKNKYDYSKVHYENNHTKVCIICPTHGEFWQVPNSHLMGVGCPSCYGNKKLTQEVFEQRANKIHNNKYDYSKSIVNGNRSKIIITCPIHGDFEQSVKNHLNGQGCPHCGKIKCKERNDITKPNHRKSTEEFKFEFKTKYADKYSIIGEYINKNSDIECYCNVLDKNGIPHGTFITKANYVLNGYGCKKCTNEKRSVSKTVQQPKKIKEKKISSRKVTFEAFENKVQEKNTNCPCTFQKENFVDMSTPMEFQCSSCGNKFKRKPTTFLNYNMSCPSCNKESYVSKNLKNTEEFIAEAQKIHNSFYSYEHTQYTKSCQKVIVTCPIHGDFSIEANSHLQGHGCPLHYCNKSKQENELSDYIISLVGQDNVVLNSKNILPSKKELDIFLPQYNIAFEYNGLYWHNELNKPKDYHLSKTKECQNIGIHLFHIFEDEWLNKPNIIKSMINSQLGLITNKIYARKCKINEIDSKTANQFLECNHLQGKCNGNYRIGLYHNDVLVSVMVFGKSRHFIGNKKEKWELIRFANLINYSVIGSASKLFNFFIQNKQPKQVISYADKRWSNGHIYDILGFKKYNESKPNYYYVINNRRIYRYNLRKDILIKKYNCPKEKTEQEFCFEQKWYRIYDCGCLCYEWSNK